MKIAEIPADFSGVESASGIIYRLSGLSAGTSYPVMIFAGNDHVGTKVYRGQQEVAVNAAAYLKEKVAVEPPVISDNGFRTMHGWTTQVRIYAAGLYSEASVIHAGYRTMPALSVLSDMCGPFILPHGSRDLIAFVAPGLKATATVSGISGVVKNVIGTYETTCEAAVTLFHVDCRALLAGMGTAERFVVELDVAGEPIGSREYITREPAPEDVPIYWINKYGCIDSYVFRSAGCSVETAKQKITTSYGLRTAYSSSEHKYYVRSGYESSTMLEQLSAVLSSPSVWIAQDGGYRSIYVEQTRNAWTDGTPGYLQLTYSDGEPVIVKRS